MNCFIADGLEKNSIFFDRFFPRRNDISQSACNIFLGNDAEIFDRGMPLQSPSRLDV